MKNRQQTILQNGIFLIIWLILFVIPIFGYRDVDTIRWDAVRMFWARMLPFLVLFCINNYLLIPRLLVPRRYLRYLGMVILTIAAILIVNHLYVRTYIFPAPAVRTERSQAPPVAKSPAKELTLTTDQPAKAEAQITKRKPRRHFRPAIWQYLLMDSIVSILLVGTNAAICLLLLSLADSQRLREMESQTLKAELDYLKTQINPHFFLNTLNNIHALVDIDAQRAKESIIELSKIMRYVLYDTNLPLVPLSKEVEFIENFVGLMRLRYTDEVRITTRYPNPLPEINLPPLMLVALVENAFKHGISYRHDSFVDLSIEVKDNRLIYTVENSCFETPPAIDYSASGVGLTNLSKRLELLFGKEGQISINQIDNRYTAILKLPIK